VALENHQTILITQKITMEKENLIFDFQNVFYPIVVQVVASISFSSQLLVIFVVVWTVSFILLMAN